MKAALRSGIILTANVLTLLCGGCESVVDDNRIPAMPVSVNLSNAGMWNTYGVAGFGLYRRFIRQTGEPGGFPFTEQTYTGFGGILLIGGMDPFTGDTQVPLAYDLACPVECKPDVRVNVRSDNFEAVCPVCDSHYDVTMAGGAPLSGPAAYGKPKYGLQRYQCIATSMGGYIITR